MQKTNHELERLGYLPGNRLPQMCDYHLSPVGAVAHLGEAAMGGLDFQKLLDLSVTLAFEVLDVEFAKVLYQPGPDQPLTVVAGIGWDDDVVIGESTVPCERGSQAGYTLLTEQPVFVEHLQTETRFSGPQLLTDHDISSGISVTIPLADHPYGVIGAHSKRRHTFTGSDGEFLRAVANIIGYAFRSEEARKKIELHVTSQERQLRLQEALAKCARALLASEGHDRLNSAITALFTATRATYAFVERNELDPELGLCSRTILEVEDGDELGGHIGDPYWELVPWSRMPISHSHMERGEPFVLIPAEIDGPEYDQYANAALPIQTELDIPIFVGGKWEGLIGFANTSRSMTWTDEDISLLSTAATMIGAFWEREATVKRLEDLIIAKDTFLASVSHELRTPLTAVLGFGEVLRDSGANISQDERDELLDMVISQGTDVANIVSDLLVAAKANIGTLDVRNVAVNLGTQVAQVVDAHGQEKLSRVEPSGQIRAIGDPERIRQIVRNLLTNATRYGGDRIRVELGTSDGMARIKVVDNGKAIAFEDRERIFQPYQRAHKSSGLAGSLGLGLAISRQLARLMDGDLTYGHEDGESIFELTLPEADL